jgi:hypothetical protein
MNYINLIITVAIFLFVFDRFFLKSNNINSNLLSNYKMDENKESIGFFKPEHRLLKILGSISSGSKINLNGNTKQFMYSKNTISTDLNEKIIYIIKDIINSINNISKTDFFMKKLENVYIMIDSKNNQRYIIDYFIYDVNNYYSIRLISDIVIINDEIYINYINVQSGSNSSLLNKYDIKFNSSGILFDANMFHDDLIKIFDNYYSNSFKVIGVGKTSLDYETQDLTSVLTLNSLKNNYLPASISSDTYEDLNKKDLSGYLEMYLPENQNTIKSPSFCNKYTNNWDNYGIENKSDNSDKNCYVNNNQTATEYNQPWFGPGVIYGRSSEDEYRWLKDPTRGNIVNDL